jgi:hypothetical protein
MGHGSVPHIAAEGPRLFLAAALLGLALSCSGGDKSAGPTEEGDDTSLSGNTSALLDREIAQAFSCNRSTVEGIRKRFVLEGLDSALERKKRANPPTERLLDGEKEALLIAVACSEPPEGRDRWTPQLLADERDRCGSDDCHAPCNGLRRISSVDAASFSGDPKPHQSGLVYRDLLTRGVMRGKAGGRDREG